MKKILFFLALVIALSACESSELHDSMEDMGKTYKAMRESEDLAVIKAQYANLKSSFDIAIAQQVHPEEQATFQEGMDKMADLIQQLETAIAADDVDGAKNILKQLGDNREDYHERLGID